MEQPESQTPSDTPEAGEGIASEPQPEQANGSTAGTDAPSPAPNPDADSANEDGGETDSADLLNQMYLDLGHLVAAHDLHRADAEKRLKELSATAQELEKQRQEALAEGDHMKYANAVRGLGELAKVAEILQNDAEDELRATPTQPQDDDGQSGERDGDGDSGSAGDGSQVAGDAHLGVGVGGDGPADGDERGDDDPSGGSGGGRAVRPE